MEECEELDDSDNCSMSSDYCNRSGKTGNWQTVSRGNKKRKGFESDEEKREENTRNEMKVILRFQNPCALNPLKISEAIHKIVGEVNTVKTLRDGNLLVLCRDRDQVQGLMRSKTLLGKTIKPQIWQERGKVMGVIYGVSTDLTEEEIKGNIKGARVI